MNAYARIAARTQRHRLAAAGYVALCALMIAACGSSTPDTAVPGKVIDGSVLYAQHCAACHGDRGMGGIGPALADPLYMRLVSDAELQSLIGDGRRPYEMPAFLASNGGDLTNDQIIAIVHAIRSYTPGLATTPQPPVPALHAAQGVTGDPGRGQAVFAADCARCHGDEGKGGRIGPINVPNAVALTSDEELRRIVITGIAFQSMPDYARVGGAPLTDQQVTDVVAYMATWRRNAAATPTPPPNQR